MSCSTGYRSRSVAEIVPSVDRRLVPPTPPMIDPRPFAALPVSADPEMILKLAASCPMVFTKSRAFPVAQMANRPSKNSLI